MALCGHGAVFPTVDSRRRQTVGGRKTAGISLTHRLSLECLCGVPAGERILLQTIAQKRGKALLFPLLGALYLLRKFPPKAPRTVTVLHTLCGGEAALWRVFAQTAKNC